MKKELIDLPGKKLVGITTRTNNAKVFESDPATNPIAATVQKFFHTGLSAKINDRKKPGTTYCIYTKYESDHNGDYTFMIGEEVDSFEHVGEEFETLEIPAQNYAKFTNEPGPMPAVCIDMWQNIWKMRSADFGGDRAYIADFEVYDERSADHNNVTLDIYIGITDSTN